MAGSSWAMEDALPTKFAGCLLGLAIGDALGAELEGHARPELFEAYLEGRLPPERIPLTMWTDDTALAVATAQSIVECGQVSGPDLAARYLAWFETDGRGIGRSTLAAMGRLQAGVPWDQAGEQGEAAAGNGVAMRIAPVGLLHWDDPNQVTEDVRTCGVITHRNEEALIGGECVAYAVARACCRDFDPEGLGIELLNTIPASRCRDGIEQALTLWQAGAGPMDALVTLGLGGAAFETVPAALYCFWLGADDLQKTLCLSTLPGGDADTRGAIAGAICGTHLGASAIPRRWVDRLPGAKTFPGLASQLLDVAAR